MTRAVIYVRVSTGAQADDGVSLAAQLDMAERYCAQRGWTLAPISHIWSVVGLSRIDHDAKVCEAVCENITSLLNDRQIDLSPLVRAYLIQLRKALYDQIVWDSSGQAVRAPDEAFLRDRIAGIRTVFRRHYEA